MEPSNKILMKTPSTIVLSLLTGATKMIFILKVIFRKYLMTIIDYYVFLIPGIVAPLRLLSNLSSN